MANTFPHEKEEQLGAQRDHPSDVSPRHLVARSSINMNNQPTNQPAQWTINLHNQLAHNQCSALSRKKLEWGGGVGLRKGVLEELGHNGGLRSMRFDNYEHRCFEVVGN
jgi:hypothetical protein